MNRNKVMEEKIQNRLAEDAKKHRFSYGGMGLDMATAEKKKELYEELAYMEAFPDFKASLFGPRKN